MIMVIISITIIIVSSSSSSRSRSGSGSGSSSSSSCGSSHHDNIHNRHHTSVLGGPFDLVSRVSKVGSGGL